MPGQTIDFSRKTTFQTFTGIVTGYGSITADTQSAFQRAQTLIIVDTTDAARKAADHPDAKIVDEFRIWMPTNFGGSKHCLSYLPRPSCKVVLQPCGPWCSAHSLRKPMASVRDAEMMVQRA